MILVTGGAGFIGSHIVDRLLSEGSTVRVLDNFSTGKAANLPRHQQLSIIKGDVADYAAVSRAMDHVEVVFHLAAVASVAKSVEEPVETQKTNYLGTLHLLDAARKSGVKRLIFSSSAAIYGDDPVLPKLENMRPQPMSPYAVDKLASELACRTFSHLYGIETVCLRYFNVYGPRQDPSSPYSGVISIFTDKIAASRQPVIFGDGEQTRDFVYVADVVAANLQAMRVREANMHVCNIATGKPTSINTLFNTMCQIKAFPFAPTYKEKRAGDINRSFADISQAQTILKWSPSVELGDGLRRLLGS